MSSLRREMIRPHDALTHLPQALLSFGRSRAVQADREHRVIGRLNGHPQCVPPHTGLAAARGANVDRGRTATEGILPRLEVPAASWAPEHPTRQQILVVRWPGMRAEARPHIVRKGSKPRRKIILMTARRSVLIVEDDEDLRSM